MQKIVTHLMFKSDAEKAILLYTSLFEDSEILSITRHIANEQGVAGSVKQAYFTLAGQEFMCSDSNTADDFTFAPPMFIYVNCNSEKEIERIYNKLGEGGIIVMALGKYPFSEKFARISDKFGISWQLNLKMKKEASIPRPKQILKSGINNS